MPRHLITFTFLSPWHMGSGFGEGSHLDALPVKSAAGLPYIPGRSVKGLFREALLLAEECSEEMPDDKKVVPARSTSELFGSREDDLSRYDSIPGKLRFNTATMGDEIEAWAAETSDGKQVNAEALKQLFMPLAATRIDDEGLAHKKSLRKIEVALPVELTAEVEYAEGNHGYGDILKTAAALIRQAGSHRHRGLGRVKVTVSEVLS